MLLSLSIFASGVLATPLTVRAVSFGSYKMYNNSTVTADGVVQGDSAGDFVSYATIATIYIDEEMINSNTMRRQAEITRLYETNTDPRAKGLRVGALKVRDSNNQTIEDFGAGAFGDEYYLIFDQRLVDDAFKIKRDQNNPINGPLISYTFKNAATTEGGQKAHVVFTYSNLNIVLQSDNSKNYRLSDGNWEKLESFSIVGGNLLQVAGTMREGSEKADESTKANNMRYGLSFDVNVKVVDDNGNLVPGDFYFRIVDIDQHRHLDSFRSLYEASNNNDFSEQIHLKDGFKDYTSGGTTRRIYVPGGTADDPNTENKGYKTTIEYNNSDGTYMFKPNVSDTHSENLADGSILEGTFYSGFLAVANNTEGGINLKAWAAGCGDAPIKTTFLAGFQGNANVVYRIISKSSGGGDIKTTSYGNTTKTLDDGGSEIGQGTLSVPNNKKITYTMTPDASYIYPEKVTIIDGLDPASAFYKKTEYTREQIEAEINGGGNDELEQVYRCKRNYELHLYI